MKQVAAGLDSRSQLRSCKGSTAAASIAALQEAAPNRLTKNK